MDIWRGVWDSNPRTFLPTVFKTVAFDLSANSPDGSPSWIRTNDTQIKNLVLYQLSYGGLGGEQMIPPAVVKKGAISFINMAWWAFWGSNPGPSGYEPDALTN